MGKTTEIVCILDRSGSMDDIMPECVNALNEFLEEQKKLPGKAKVTLVAFDNQYIVVFDRLKLKTCPRINITDVMPRGMTALYDAIGKTIDRLEGKKDVVMLIQTDGFENASREYDLEKVREMIKAKKAEGWDISFMGSNIDAHTTGTKMGVDVGKTVNIPKDQAGMAKLRTYATVTATSYRSTKE